MASTSPNPIVRTAAAILTLALALLGVSIVLASPSSARASGTPREGRGYSVSGGDFVGYYVTTTGRKLYCLSPRRGLPSSITLTKVRHYPGLSAAKSAQLSYALGKWGDAGTNKAAAAESQVLNTIVGNLADVSRRASQLPDSVAKLVRAHLKTVHRYYGPYVTKVRTGHAVLPGQDGTASVTISSIATGRKLRHIPITLSGSKNVRLPKHVFANGKGIARFSFRVTDVGEVHIVASAKHLPSMSVYQNHPGNDAQHMISPVHTTHTRGSVSFKASPNGFRHKYACTTTCNGRPKTTVRACNPKNHQKSRLVIHYGKKTAIIHFPKSAVRICEKKQITTRDGEHVWSRWQFKTKHGWSKPVVARGSFTVDCPAVPAVGVTLSANCTKATVTIGLAKLGKHGTWSALANPSKHTMVLIIGGATDRRIYAKHGRTAIFTAHASCTSPRTYTWQAGVRRANGKYNYGPKGSITTPGPAAAPQFSRR